MAPSYRKNENDKWMPPRVYRGKSAYEYHPPGGGAIRLGSFTASKADIWIAYEKNFESKINDNTVSFLINKYINCDHFNLLAPATQKDYFLSSKRIEETFGKMIAGDVLPVDVRNFMDYRGKESKRRANSERTFLYNVMRLGFEYGLVKQNPCIGIKPYKLKPRKRYVTDDEYRYVYDLASPNLQAIMEIAYLCAARSGDIRSLKLEDIQENGLFIEQNKTGKKQIKMWTDRLKDAINLGKNQPSKMPTKFIIHNNKGQAYSEGGLKGMFGKLIDKAMGICRKKENETNAEYETRKKIFIKKYPRQLTERFSLHDLKAKGISDYKGDKLHFSGHTSVSMMEIYNRTADVVEIVDPNKMNNK